MVKSAGGRGKLLLGPGAGANDYRNPNLAAVLKELGYVQRFGFGIATARSAMEKNGNPQPEFLVEDAHIAVILRSRP
ncbi:MAG: ATP-binding protein [Pseudomonadota bacterium]